MEGSPLLEFAVVLLLPTLGGHALFVEFRASLKGRTWRTPAEPPVTLRLTLALFGCLMRMTGLLGLAIVAAEAFRILVSG